VFIDPEGLVWLRSNGDDPTYKWVDDNDFSENSETWKDWSVVETGSVINLGWVGGDYEKYSHLIGSDVILGDRGEVLPVGAADVTLSVTAQDPDSNGGVTGWARLIPDFYTIQVNIAIPTKWTGTLAGVSPQVTLDRYGNLYWAPGISVGKSATGVSGSFTYGYLTQSATPSENQISGFLSGGSVNAGFGFGAGMSGTWAPWADGTNTAIQYGLYTPQIGTSANYAFRYGNVLPKAWRGYE
jgi:hypothetical protein